MIFPNRFQLKGRIAVVTGGAGLIGTAICQAFAQAGAKVYIAEINAKSGRDLKKTLVSQKCSAEYISLDITSEASIKSAISQMLRRERKIDIWVNNAYPRTADWGNKIEEIKASSLKKNVDMHMNGYFLCCQNAVKEMKKRKSGVIINMGSHYGILGPNFSVYEGTKMTMPAAYSLIKGGIVNFSRYLATYCAPYNIRVNALCPGGIFDNQPDSFVERYKKLVPLNRMGCPEDIAGAALFLASDASAYVTGHVLMVDGGLSAW
jgi:NAD(P)-dependent dehydrogenase (short-subunit alcohol dehydrogenase family)